MIRYFLLLYIAIVTITTASTAVGAEYKLLAPLPGGTAVIDMSKDAFSIYASQFFWFLLSASIILALVMVVVGGVQYVGAAGNTSVLEDAKNRIKNALLGLVIALGSWLVLYSINPDLVKFELPVPCIPNITNPPCNITQPPPN